MGMWPAGALVPVHVAYVAVLALLARDIAASLGTSTTTVALAAFVMGLGALGSSAARARWGRGGTGHVDALVAVVCLAGLATATTVGRLLLVSVVAGIAAGVVPGRHVSSAWTLAPAEDRVGVLATLGGAGLIPLVVVGHAATLTGSALTWRGITSWVTALCLGIVVLSWLRPRPADSTLAPATSQDVRRAMTSPVVRRAASLATVAGLGLVPATHVAGDLLLWTWGQQGAALGSALAGAWGVAAVGLVALGAIAHRGERTAVSAVPAMGPAISILTAVAFLVAASSGHRIAAVIALGVGLGGLVGLLLVALVAALDARGPAGGWVSTAVLAAAILGGGPLGLLLFGGVQRRFDTPITIGSFALVGVLALVQARWLARDVAATLGDVEVAPVTGASTLLACHGVDVSYGQLQVLFDVDFNVDEGEMVALLGTNGAGKSTLLRTISGLQLPDRGSIHFAGQDVTYLSAERRVAMGIAQVPGGRAVFGPMSVVENLRVFGHALGRDRAAIDAGIEATFEAFPRLAERRNLSAGVLSGGEQQMLALGKVLMLHPRVLLIDELSLGLAPAVVAELLEMVRRVNQAGTAVVLVEQSVNIALSLVNHAYFMERGRIRFDGPARELVERDDLVRSVFLQGAAAATGED